MGNLVDCLKKAKRLTPHERGAIADAHEEYLPYAKTSHEASVMAVNAAIEAMQQTVASIYQQAGVPMPAPVAPLPNQPGVVTESQQKPAPTKQTDTQAFKAWFGGSKAVDADGNPLVVYHGTTAPPEQFSEKRLGKASNVFGSWENERHGIFVAEDPSLAEEFAGKRPGASIMPMYIRAEDPIDLRGFMGEGLFNSIEEKHGYHMAKWISDRMGANAWKLFDSDEGNDPAAVIKVFKDMGYDSAIIEESRDTKNANNKTWVLFDSDQVKSATGNSGKFDPKNPDITDAPSQMAIEAQKRINKRARKNRLYSDALGVATVYDAVANGADLTIIAADALRRTAFDKARWTAEMIRMMGSAIKVHLEDLYKKAQDAIAQEEETSPAPRNPDAYARTKENIEEVIPPPERFIGPHEEGVPITRPDGSEWHGPELDEKTGDLGFTQPEIDKMWEIALDKSGPAARRALEQLRKEGHNPLPPGAEHWKAAGNLPKRDRFWYEISAESMRRSFPSYVGKMLTKVADMIAATSPMADPNYNAELAISILAEETQGKPITTPAVNMSGVSDASVGKFGEGESRKVGSFSNTFKFLMGILKDPPLSTNDRQVAASFGIPDAAIGKYPVLYEAISRFYNEMRDDYNQRNAGKFGNDGPMQSFQLQALSWVQTRADGRMERSKEMSELDAFNGDAYGSAFKLAADKLENPVDGGTPVQVPRDAHGNPLFTNAVLSNPRTIEILAPTAKTFAKSTMLTQEVGTKKTETGRKFEETMAQSQKLGIKGNIELYHKIINRYLNALSQREAVEGQEKKNPSPISALVSVFAGEDVDVSRIEKGYGTYLGEFSRNARAMIDAVPEEYREAFLAVLGKALNQGAGASSRFIPNDKPFVPAPKMTRTHSVFLNGVVDVDARVKVMAEELSRAGYDINVSSRPNGLIIDINPKYNESAPNSLEGITQEMAQDGIDKAFGAGNHEVYSVDHRSDYVDESRYDEVINKANETLLDSYAQSIAQHFNGSGEAALGSARDFLRSDQRTSPETLKAGNFRAISETRREYRARLDKLSAATKAIEDIAKRRDQDMAEAIPVMEKRIEANAKRDGMSPSAFAAKKRVLSGKLRRWSDKVIAERGVGSGAMNTADPELIAAYVYRIGSDLVAELKVKAVDFQEWYDRTVKQYGETVKDKLQQIWDDAQTGTVRDDRGEPVQAQSYSWDEETTRSKGSLLDFETASKGTDEEKIDFANEFADEYIKDGDYNRAIDIMRKMPYAPMRVVVGAEILSRAMAEMEKRGDGGRDMSLKENRYLDGIISTLLNEVMDEKTLAGQTLQAQRVVNKLLEPHWAELAWRGVLKSQLEEEVQPDFLEGAAGAINTGIGEAGNTAGRVVSESKDPVMPPLSEAEQLLKDIKDWMSKIQKADPDIGEKIMAALPEPIGNLFREFYTKKGTDGLAKNFWQLMAGPQGPDGHIVTFDNILNSELGRILKEQMKKAGFENKPKTGLSAAEQIAMFLSEDPLKGDKLKLIDEAVREDINAREAAGESSELMELWDSIMGVMNKSAASETMARRVVQEMIKEKGIDWKALLKMGNPEVITDAKAQIVQAIIDKVNAVKPGTVPADKIADLKANVTKVVDEIVSIRQSAYDKNKALMESKRLAAASPETEAQSLINQFAKIQSDTPSWPVKTAKPMRELVTKYLKDDVTREQFLSQAASLGVNSATAETLLQLTDRQKYNRALWESIDRANNLTEFLSDHENMLAPIRRIAKNLGMDLRDIFSDLPENQQKAAQEIAARMAKNPEFAGMSESDRKRFSDTFVKAWQTVRDGVVMRDFNKLVPLVTVKTSGKTKLQGIFPELLKRANMGLLDNRQFLEAMGELYGITKITDETGKKLRELSQKAMRTPEGSERNKVYQEIMDTIMQARGVKVSELLNDYWFRNVMSAPRTAFEILGGGVIQGAARTMLSALDTRILKENPVMALRFIKMFAQDVGAGVILGLDLIRTGDRSILPRYQEHFLSKMRKLEQGQSPGGFMESKYRNSTGLAKLGAAPYEMWGRVLTALDYVGGQGIRSQQMLYAALLAGDKASVDAAMRRFNKDLVAKAREQALTELKKLGDPRRAQVMARTREILNEGISKEIQNYGNKMTEVAALNAPPVGVSGIAYRAIARLPWWSKAGLGLAFAKAGLNLVQEYSNYSPVTGQINWARMMIDPKSKNWGWLSLKGEDMPEARRRQVINAQAMGLIFTAGIASMFLGGDDDEERTFEISGGWRGMTPDEQKRLRDAGERPYSIRFTKDGRWYDYKQWPVVANLAMVGHIRDMQRFKPKEFDEKSVAGQITDAWLSGILAIKDMSVSRQLSSALNILADDPRGDMKGEYGRRFLDTVGSAAGGLLPAASLLREVDQYIDQQRYDVDRKNPGLETFLSTVPFVRGHLSNSDRPSLNSMGQPIEIHVNPFNRHIGPGKTTDPVMRAWADKISQGTTYPGLGQHPQIVAEDPANPGKLVKRDMTDDEEYLYRRSVLRALARQTKEDLEAFKEATPQQASNYLTEVMKANISWVSERMNKGVEYNNPPLDPKLKSALSPDYERALNDILEDAPQRMRDTADMAVAKDDIVAAGRDRERITEVMKTVAPEDRQSLMNHAMGSAPRRDALESKIKGMRPEVAAKYLNDHLDAMTDPAERAGYTSEIWNSGLVPMSVLREMGKLKKAQRDARQAK